MKTVDFLDVDLSSEAFRPYKKPNDRLQYVHMSSNHPRNILKQLPTSINNRLTMNSSNEAVFENAKAEYEEALRNSGYSNPNLVFRKQTSSKTTRRNQKRSIIWFNPPFSKNVATNVARSFLRLIAKHFTTENNLRKVFNKNCVKVSYSCTENVGSSSIHKTKRCHHSLHRPLYLVTAETKRIARLLEIAESSPLFTSAKLPLQATL